MPWKEESLDVFEMSYNSDSPEFWSANAQDSWNSKSSLC